MEDTMWMKSACKVTVYLTGPDIWQPNCIASICSWSESYQRLVGCPRMRNTIYIIYRNNAKIRILLSDLPQNTYQVYLYSSQIILITKYYWHVKSINQITNFIFSCQNIVFCSHSNGFIYISSIILILSLVWWLPHLHAES